MRETDSANLRLALKSGSRSVPASDRYDKTYARFVQGCEPFHEEIEQLLGRAVTPRELDKVLLTVADRTP